MLTSIITKENQLARRPKASQRTVRAVLKLLIFTALLFWIAPSLSIAAPGAMLSRDSGLALLACVSRIPDALSIITEERERTAAEQAAFKNFSTRVAALETTEIESTTVPTGVGLRSPKTGAAATLVDVQDAYRNTVMGVSHYEEEYDESLTANMTAEFGVDLAAVVDNNDVLTPPVRQALIQASHTAQQDRASFNQTLANERDVVTDARRRLREISQTIDHITTGPFDQYDSKDLLDAEDQVQALKATCNETLQDRQQQLHDGPIRRGVHLQEYLYASHSWTYPVIADTLDCLSRCREIGDQISLSILCRR
jgi:hypothetical protein